MPWNVFRFLASDGSLYLVVNETSDISIYTSYLIKVHGGSGALIWKMKIPDNQTIYRFAELTAGAISVLYRDANANSNTFLKTLSSQDGSVLQNVYLSSQYVGGIAAFLTAYFPMTGGGCTAWMDGLLQKVASQMGFWRRAPGCTGCFAEVLRED